MGDPHGDHRMSLAGVRERLERHQIALYFGAVLMGALVAWLVPASAALDVAINPALALMLFVTFLQVPLAELKQAMKEGRFLVALLVANFVAIPLLVFVLLPLLPEIPLVRLGVLLVLLTPCIDYVVTFAHLGRADARLLLAATPLLLIAQMVLLPVYLGVFLGEHTADLVQPGPFVHAFVWLIALPLLLAALTQWWAATSSSGARAFAALGVLPVPSTAVVLFVVIAAVVPQLGAAVAVTLQVAPVYVLFAIAAPLIGWAVARGFRLQAPAARSVAFSTGTRNSLVVLPLALAVPGAIPILPAVIVTQTLVELLGELVYVRLIASFGRSTHPTRSEP